MPNDFDRKKNQALRAALKHHHLKCGGTEQRWQEINTNPTLFNRLWRAFLGLPRSDDPPPKIYR